MSYLLNLTREEFENGVMPIDALLKNSLFYPACGLDGGVVKDCNVRMPEAGIVSFVYCDYAKEEEHFIRYRDTFKGYHLLWTRPVRQEELVPRGWQMQLPPGFTMREYGRFRPLWRQYGHWSIYQKNDDMGAEHGPERFSLLYLGGEGVATYQALYWSNQQKPRALAIIQPGTGFGFNWTDFRRADAPLAWVVQQNPAGNPQYVYYGGIGRGYQDFYWRNYQLIRIIEPYYPRYQGQACLYCHI